MSPDRPRRLPGWLHDRATPSLLGFGMLGATGFLAVQLGWKVAARTLDVSFQTPAVISGGMGGVALVLVGVSLVSVQSGRRLAAEERVQTEDVLDEAAALVDAMKRRRS